MGGGRDWGAMGVLADTLALLGQTPPPCPLLPACGASGMR